MKTFRILYRGVLLLMILSLGLLMLPSCGGGEKSANEKALEERREQTLEDISTIRADLEERIKYVDEELENAVGELRETLLQAKADLEEQKELLTRELENIKSATLETWNDVVAKASRSIGDAREKTIEVSKTVREKLDSEEKPE